VNGEYQSRPWSHSINKAAWQKRHKFGVDGRLHVVIVPLVIFSGFGFAFGRVSMIVAFAAAAGVWFIGKLLWTWDPWALDKAWLRVTLPRWGCAVQPWRAPSCVDRFLIAARQRLGC
jgi:hypothetical protein